MIPPLKNVQLLRPLHKCNVLSSYDPLISLFQTDLPDALQTLQPHSTPPPPSIYNFPILPTTHIAENDQILQKTEKSDIVTTLYAITISDYVHSLQYDRYIKFTSIMLNNIGTVVLLNNLNYILHTYAMFLRLILFTGFQFILLKYKRSAICISYR